MKKCKKCSIIHYKDGAYCSHSCANSRTWSADDKRKKSLAAKSSVKVLKANSNRVELVEKICVQCSTTFSVIPCNRRITCSPACAKKKRSKNMGGFRIGAGRSKSGYFRGIYCNSTYELVWVIYELDHGRSPKRFEGYLTDGVIKYYPDFVYDKHIIEIKGYYVQAVEHKSNIARAHGYSIDVLYKEDLRAQFEYVASRYNTTQYEKLYEGGKYALSYVCHFCKREYVSFVKKKNSRTYCSQSCAGNGVQSLRL